MAVYLSTSLDPYKNLAMEKWLSWRAEIEGRPLLFLWQVDKAIFIGRTQNPWVECQVEKLEKEKVPLVRRDSGGGTVYCDKGTLLYSYITPPEDFSRDKFLHFLVEHLESQYKIPLELTPRNDLFFKKTLKVSGNAYREGRKVCIHHGTLLVDTNLDKLGEYLAVSRGEIERFTELRGVRSKISKVCNLTDIESTSTKSLIKSLAKGFRQHFLGEKKGRTKKIDIEKVLLTNELLVKYLEKLRSNDWVYGKTPTFKWRDDDKKAEKTIVGGKYLGEKPCDFSPLTEI